MTTLSFEDFEIRTADFQLTRRGAPVPLEPLVYDLLVLLVTQAGRVVTKDEILDQVWDGRFVSESTISTALKSLRKALGDDGQSQRLIKTVHRRGYRFAGEVSRAAAPARAPGALQQDIAFVAAPDGTQIATASMGQGPVILRAAHWLSNISFDCDSPVFRHWFAALSEENRFVRYDLRGSGLSDREVEEMSFDAFLGDFEAVAARIDEPLTLLGMSQGGPIALAFAAKHPERVKRIVLFGSYTQGMMARAKTAHQRMEAETIVNLIRLGWGRDHPAFNQIFTNLFIPGGTPEQHAWWRDLEVNTASAEMAARIVTANNAIDITEIATQIRAPTIVFHSQRDTRVPFDQGRRLAAAIPGAQFVPLDSANHCLLEDEPAWPVFLAAFRAFLRETE